MPCRCGNHLPSNGNLVDTLSGCSDGGCCQLFLGFPTRYDIRKLKVGEGEAARKYLNDKDIKMYTHSPYVINLAREGDESIVEKSRASLQSMVDTLASIDTERTGTVVHIGAKGTIENVCRELNNMNITVPVLMENSAGEGTKQGKNIDELRKIIEGTDSRKVGICIDTCHSFAAGMFDLREASETEKLFESLDFMSGRQLIFHVNDSLADYKAKLDRHAPIGYGHIWNINRQGSMDNLHRFYELAKMGCYDIIFETPNPVNPKLETELYKEI